MAKRETGSFSVDKVGAFIGIATVIFGAGVAWQSISNNIERLEERVNRLSYMSASDLCLAVVQRQIAAIEQEKLEVQRRLQELAGQHGCLERYDIVTATVPASAEQQREAARRLAEERRNLERELIGIDDELQLHPDIRASAMP